MPEVRLQFGALDQPAHPVAFCCGEVRPLTSDPRDQLQAHGETLGHTDGWIYPSTLPWIRGAVARDGTEAEVEWPATEPKPEIWAVEPTHELLWSDAQPVDKNRVLPAIVINALGWAYGNQVQFADWRIEGRVRWRCAPAFYLPPTHIGVFLDSVLHAARAPGTNTTELLSALILHNRVPIYTSDWERFHWQYVVFDACWRILEDAEKVEAERAHKRRIAMACKCLGIPPVSGPVLDRIVDQRNDLAHQGLWCGGIPGYQGCTEAGFDYFRLRRLVDRLLLHILGVDCELRTSSWEVESLMTQVMGMKTATQPARPPP